MNMESCKVQTAYRWLIMVGAFITSIINIGVCASFGALFVSISETFETTRSAAALVQSLMLATMVSALIAGLLIERYRILKTSILATSFIISGFGSGFFANSIVYIYIFVSVIAGIGTTTMYMCGTVAIGLISEGRTKSTALAINTSCIGIGASIFPYLLNRWESVYGLNGTCLIMSALCFNNICFVILLSNVSSKTEYPNERCEIYRNKTENRHAGFSNQVMNDPIKTVISRIKSRLVTTFNILYTLTMIASVSVMATVDAYVVLYVDIYIWKLFSKEQAILSMTLYYIAYITAGLSVGALKLTKNVNLFAMSLAYTLIGITGTVLLYLSSSWSVAYAGSALMGVLDGGSWSVVNLIVAELVSEQQYGVAYGLIITVLAFVAVAAGPLFAMVRDATQSYEVVFLVIGTMQICSAVIYLKCWLLHRKSTSNTTPKDEQMTKKSTAIADSNVNTSTVTHM